VESGNVTLRFFHEEDPVERVHGKKPQVTLALMSNSPFHLKEVKSNLLGESCSLSDITYSRLFFHVLLQLRVTLF